MAQDVQFSPSTPGVLLRHPHLHHLKRLFLLPCLLVCLVNNNVGPDLELEDEDREVELPLAADGVLVGGINLSDLESNASGGKGNHNKRDQER